MFIKFEGKEHEYFGNLVYSWLIKSKDNEWRLTKTFIGAFDEDGNENIYRSMGCEIALTELKTNTPFITQVVRERAEKELYIDFEEDNQDIGNCEFLDSFFYYDEGNIESSEKITNNLVSILLKTIIEDAFKSVA